MNGYGFYKIYKPLHLHFTTSDYDVFKYNGKVKSLNNESYNKRKDANLFESWSAHFHSAKNIGQYCLANFIYNEPNWVYQSKQQADETFLKWKSIRDSQLHFLKNDLNVLSKIVEAKKVQSFWNLFEKTPSGNKPPLLQLFIAGSFGKESIIIIDHWCYPFLTKWEHQYEIDPLISDQIFTLKKYAPFIVNTIDSAKVKELFRETTKENETT